MHSVRVTVGGCCGLRGWLRGVCGVEVARRWGRTTVGGAAAADRQMLSRRGRVADGVAGVFASRISATFPPIAAWLRRGEHVAWRDDQNRRMVRLSGRAGRRSRRACRRQNGRACRVALGSPRLRECEDWALGVYHGVRKNFQSYLDELVFSFNSSKTSQVAFSELLAIGMVEKFIIYNMLIIMEGEGFARVFLRVKTHRRASRAPRLGGSKIEGRIASSPAPANSKQCANVASRSLDSGRRDC